MTDKNCKCSAVHHPKVLEPQAHHLWPVYLGGPEARATLIYICPNTHTNLHRILRAMVKAKKWLPRNPGEPKYSHHLATLGFQAWQASLETPEQQGDPA